MRIKEVAKKLVVIYKLFNWCWADSDEPPSSEEIEKALRILIVNIKRLNSDVVETGGLYIEKNSGVYTAGFRTDLGFDLDYDEVEKIIKET